MSEEQLKAFLEKVKADTRLQEKLKAAGSNEAALEIAKEAGFAITAEDIQSMQSQSGEVSDAELEAAAGGFEGGNGFSRQRQLGRLSGNCPEGVDRQLDERGW